MESKRSRELLKVHRFHSNHRDFRYNLIRLSKFNGDISKRISFIPSFRFSIPPGYVPLEPALFQSPESKNEWVEGYYQDGPFPTKIVTSMEKTIISLPSSTRMFSGSAATRKTEGMRENERTIRQIDRFKLSRI